MIYYERNMQALKEAQPDLYKWLEAQPTEVDWISLTENNLLLRTGARTRLMYDDASRKQAYNIKELTTLHRENITVFVGMGLGDAQARVLQKMEKGHVMFVVEPCGQIIRWAFERYDFTKAIRDNSMLICVGENEVAVIMPTVESRRIVEEWFLIVEPYARERREYVKLVEHTQQIINQLRCNTGTIMGAGAKIADNDIATLPFVIRHRGVDELKDFYKGKPAVLVSTGPSLERNIHLLKDVRDKVIIIAVAQALRPLLAYDIKPDFICTVDFGEVNMSHLAGLLDEDVPLVTINRAYAPLVKAYKGPKFICANVDPAFEKTAHVALAGRGQIEQGGSVAHMCFGLALHLGCDPLIFIGQDLALTGGKSHFNQADSSGTTTITESGEIRWKVNDVRSTLHDGDYSMGEVQWVPGYYGEPVPTNVGLLSFLTTFEALVKFCGRKVINATEGGARIVGTFPLFLDEALKEYTDTIDKSAMLPLLTLRPDADEQVKNAIPLLEHDINNLKQIDELCEKSLVYSTKLMKASSTPRIKELLTQHTLVTAEAEKLSKENPLITLAIYWAQRRIMQRDMLNNKKRTTAAHLIRNKADLRVRINRSSTIIKAAKETATELLKTYEASLDTLKRYVGGDGNILNPSGEITLPNLEDAWSMLEAGNFAKPLLEARRIITFTRGDVFDAIDIETHAEELRVERISKSNTMRKEDKANDRHKLPMYFKLIEEGQVAGRGKRYDDVIPMLDEAIALMPERAEAKWGKASALAFLERYEEAIELYDSLIVDFPDDLKYKFERGQTKLRAGKIAEGMKEIGEILGQSDKFDHVLKSVSMLYKQAGLHDEAKTALSLYCEKFPQDEEAKKELLKTTS
jgi:hypothetical protein